MDERSSMTCLRKMELQWLGSRGMFTSIIAFSLLALLSPQCFAETPLTDEEYHALWRKDKKTTPDLLNLNRERKYRTFRTVNAFYVQILLEGSAEKLGLDRESLESYLRLRFANDLKDYSRDPSTMQNLKDDEGGFFTCVIWTVRDRYPIALHIECSASVLFKEEKWHNEILGINNEETVKDTVRKSLRDFVEEFAVFFLKAKGVM